MEDKNINSDREAGVPEINESNAAKRLKLLGDKVEDRIHDETLAKKKGNFFVELWYRHKWALIIGAVFLFIGMYFIFTAATDVEYDMYVAYAGPLYVDYETKEAIDFAFESVMKDYNGDGEKKFNFAGTTFQNEEQRKQTAEEMKENYGAILQTKDNADALLSIETQIMSGSVAIYLMDEALYKKYASNLMDLEELLGVTLPERIKAGQSGVYFKKTEFFYYMYSMEEGRALNNLPDDTVLCILPRITTMDEELHANSVALIKEILSFTATNR